jgi:molybdate transport system substrate-binding protein
MRVTVAAAATAAVLTLSSAGCQARPSNTVIVFAASSLTETFTALGDAFTDAGVVELSVGGSADLLTQLTHGAEADVFASADIATMDKAVRAGLLDGPTHSFATNVLTIAVAPGNPHQVNSFRDLARVSTAVCAIQVPCGAALPGLQSRTGVQLRPISEESSVTDVLNKVTSGQADAGLVYLTDALAAGGKVTAVEFPEASSATNTYEVGVLKTARDAPLARRFVELVTGATGRRVLGSAGFGEP